MFKIGAARDCPVWQSSTTALQLKNVTLTLHVTVALVKTLKVMFIYLFFQLSELTPFLSMFTKLCLQDVHWLLELALAWISISESTRVHFKSRSLYTQRSVLLCNLISGSKNKKKMNGCSEGWEVS